MPWASGSCTPQWKDYWHLAPCQDENLWERSNDGAPGSVGITANIIAMLHAVPRRLSLAHPALSHCLQTRGGLRGPGPI